MSGLAERIAIARGLLPMDTPYDALPQAIAAQLNEPAADCLAPELKPVNLPDLVAEGLLTSDQINAAIANPLTAAMFRSVVIHNAEGMASIGPAMLKLFTLLRVALILDEAQVTAITARFDLAAIVAADESLPEGDRRYRLVPSPWSAVHLGRPAAGADISPYL